MLTDYLTGFDDEPGYLDFARFGPLSAAVAAEAGAQLELLRRARHGAIDRLATGVDRMRAAASGLTGFRDDQIVFQPSVGDALAQVIFGLTGGILMARAESPALAALAVRASDALHATAPLWLETDHGRVTPGQIREQLTSTTTAVAVSAVDARTGYVADLEGIREVIGERLLVVDATCAFGAIQAPWAVADALAVSGASWLRAGAGTAFLALSDRAVKRLTPVLSGPGGLPGGEWADGDVPPPSPGAAAFQLDEPDAVAAARLAAALEELADAGADAVAAAVRERVGEVLAIADEYGVPVVSPRGESERAGIVVLEAASDQATALTASLLNHGVSIQVEGGRVRVSPHAGTTDETLGMFRAAILAFSTTTRVVR